jgi:hypothetical protein
VQNVNDETSLADRWFAPDYTTARRRFREAVAKHRGRLDSLTLTPKGPTGEELAIDIGWFGSPRPRHAFVHSSGLHGVEGFPGSAIQLCWLEEPLPALPPDAAIVLVHVVNPYGMAWLRRANENNVDLNRNYLARGEEYAGAPVGFAEVDPLLNPSTPPVRDLFYARMLWMVLRHGIPMLKQAIAAGQYQNPQGLFFGGHRLEQGPGELQHYMRTNLADLSRAVVIDVHTGLGRSGEDQLFIDGDAGRASARETLRNAFGERVRVVDGGGVTYEVRGGQQNLYYDASPAAAVYYVTQEFGTYPPARILDALRAENRWHQYGAGLVDHWSKVRLREMFSPRSAQWRHSILGRGKDVMARGLRLAFGDETPRWGADGRPV